MRDKDMALLKSFKQNCWAGSFPQQFRTENKFRAETIESRREAGINPLIQYLSMKLVTTRASSKIKIILTLYEI